MIRAMSSEYWSIAEAFWTHCEIVSTHSITNQKIAVCGYKLQLLGYTKAICAHCAFGLCTTGLRQVGLHVGRRVGTIYGWIDRSCGRKWPLCMFIYLHIIKCVTNRSLSIAVSNKWENSGYAPPYWTIIVNHYQRKKYQWVILITFKIGCAAF